MGANFDVVLFSERGLDRAYAEETAAWFQRVPGPISINVVHRTVEVRVGADGLLTVEEAFGRLAELRAELQIPEATILFLLTKTPNEGNYFAASDGEARAGFGHVDDFRWVTPAPVSVILTRYIFEAVFGAALVSAGIPENALNHEDSRGCLFDYCARKWELSLSLRTADICADCMQVLLSVSIPDALLQQTVGVMEASRRLALTTAQYLTADTPFQRWPFPVAVTRHKSAQAADPLLRFLSLLDHFDSLVLYCYLAREIQSGRTPSIVDRPSLGWWVDQLASSINGQSAFREVVAIAQEEKVVQLRNEKRGHGWVASRSQHYSGDVERLESILKRIEDELDPFLVGHQLVIPRHLSLQPEGYLVEGDLLSGSNLLHPTFRITLESDPRSMGISAQDRVFIADRQLQSFQDISPYIRAEVCPTCNHPRVLITDGGRQYIDAFIGHRVSLKGGVPGPTESPHSAETK